MDAALVQRDTLKKEVRKYCEERRVPLASAVVES
jgi:hypothetical protein